MYVHTHTQNILKLVSYITCNLNRKLLKYTLQEIMLILKHEDEYYDTLDCGVLYLLISDGDYRK